MYTTIDQIKDANTAAGQYFFNADTMRFFRSRVESPVYGGRYFITSEQFVESLGKAHKRTYTVRYAEDDGHITNETEFSSLLSYRDAEKEIEKLIAKAELKRILPEGSTVYIQFIQSAAIGNSRPCTHVYLAVVDGEIWQMDSLFATAYGWKFRETVHTARGINTGFDNGESHLLTAMHDLYGNSHAWKMIRWQ